MLKKDKIIQDKYNGVHPTCQCGCGGETKYEQCYVFGKMILTITSV
jgi:hypothetical protein